MPAGPIVPQDPPPAHSPDRSVAVDLLRGLAVLMVMIAHLPFSLAGMEGGGGAVFPPRWLADAMAHGHYGVQLFLVISGYCIHTRWARRGDKTLTVPFVAFWKRRLVRLYPPYIVVVIGSVALTLVGGRFTGVALDRYQLATDLVLLALLAQNLNDAGTRIGNPPLWSLALEEQLYLLYFPLLALRRRRGWVGTLALVLVVNAAWLAAIGFLPRSYVIMWTSVAPAYWFAWTLGALAAESHRGITKLPEWSSSLSLFLCAVVAGALLPQPLQSFVITASFFVLLHWVLRLEMRGALARMTWVRPLVRLGEISYGVYLVHNVAFIVSKRVMVSLGVPTLLVLGLRFGAGLLAGYILYKVVEVPFLRRAQRIRVPLVAARNDAGAAVLSEVNKN